MNEDFQIVRHLRQDFNTRHQNQNTQKRKIECNVNRDNQGGQRKSKGLENYPEINGDVSSENKYWDAIKKVVFRK